MSDTNPLPRLLTVEELAAVLHLSPDTVRRKASVAPADLPPRVKALSKLLWSPEIVQEWFRKQSEGEPVARVSVVPGRVGRPRRVV